MVPECGRMTAQTSILRRKVGKETKILTGSMLYLNDDAEEPTPLVMWYRTPLSDQP